MNAPYQSHSQTSQEAAVAIEYVQANSKYVVSIGMRFGRLTVESRAPSKTRIPRWTCRCDCGAIREVEHYALAKRITVSCGCFRRDNAGKTEASVTHGMAGTRVYRIWLGVHARCENPNIKNFKRYGGRGITVCERWNNFENFLADMGIPEPGLSIDRIDNDGNYCPENCRWATAKQQQRNKSSNRLITAFGETKPIAVWAEDPRISVDRYLIASRINNGWNDVLAITKPKRKCAK